MSKKTKKFYLHKGDRVKFKTKKGKKMEGTVLIIPHGRRLWGAVRDDDRVIHVLPKRDNFLEVL